MEIVIILNNFRYCNTCPLFKSNNMDFEHEWNVCVLGYKSLGDSGDGSGSRPKEYIDKHGK